MKRSSCLSALLVGLSVVAMSSAASAAPPKKAKKPKTAQPAPVAEPKTEAASSADDAESSKAKTVQPTDPPAGEGSGTTPAPAPADPTPAAADPTPAAPAPAESTQPAITLGGSTTPGADTPGSSAEEPKKKPPMRRWAGSQVFTYVSASTSTFFKDQTQYNNPTVDYSLWLQPRFALSEAFQLRGLLVFNYEFTNADDTTTKNEPRFSDTSIGLWYRKIPEIPVVGIKTNVAVGMGFPTSPESRARSLVVNPSATVQLSKAFEHIGSGEIDLIGSMVYAHPFYRYETPGVRGNFPYSRSCVGDATTCSGQLTGTANASDTFAYSLIVSGEWGKWSPAIMYRGTSQWAYTHKSVDGVVQNGQVLPLSDTKAFNAQSVRQLSYFSFWLDYNANSWLTAEVGYWMSRSLLGEDGIIHNPFFDRYQDMRVYLGANFNIDNLMKTLEGGSADAGIVRAKNDPKKQNGGPAVSFF